MTSRKPLLRTPSWNPSQNPSSLQNSLQEDDCSEPFLELSRQQPREPSKKQHCANRVHCKRRGSETSTFRAVFGGGGTFFGCACFFRNSSTGPFRFNKITDVYKCPFQVHLSFTMLLVCTLLKQPFLESCCHTTPLVCTL